MKEPRDDARENERSESNFRGFDVSQKEICADSEFLRSSGGQET